MWLGKLVRIQRQDAKSAKHRGRRELIILPASLVGALGVLALNPFMLAQHLGGKTGIVSVAAADSLSFAGCVLG